MDVCKIMVYNIRRDTVSNNDNMFITDTGEIQQCIWKEKKIKKENNKR